MSRRYLELEKINDETYLIQRDYQRYLKFRLELVLDKYYAQPTWVLAFKPGMLYSTDSYLERLDSSDLAFISFQLRIMNKELSEKIAKEKAQENGTLTTKLRCKLKWWA